MADELAGVTARQISLTELVASPKQILPLIRLSDLNETAMSRAANGESGANSYRLDGRNIATNVFEPLAPLVRYDFDDSAPGRAIVVEQQAVAEDVEAALSPREGNTNSVVDVEETDLVVLI